MDKNGKSNTRKRKIRVKLIRRKYRKLMRGSMRSWVEKEKGTTVEEKRREWREGERWNQR